MAEASQSAVADRLAQLRTAFPHWEKTRDLIDNLLDVMLNYRQSGHPGGSRSKVHALLTLLLGGAMRWDIRAPEKRFADRFVLVAGHTVPLIYCTMAVLDEALRIKYEQTGDEKYRLRPERAVFWEDLLSFRRWRGLPGHAEMAGKTLFLKFNTGPSGHGSPAAAGEALALKRAGAGCVRVFALEGEGGLSAGAAHETMNSAWGLGLDNLHYLLDWNDFGIDAHPVSAVTYGTPADWFGSHGWRVYGVEQGSEWEPLAQALLAMTAEQDPQKRPAVMWFKTRKGRGYGKYDYASHGVPHPLNSEAFWATKREFAERYGVEFVNMGGPAPADPQALRAEFRANLEVIIGVLRRDQALVDYLADTLIAIGDSVPAELPTFRLGKRGNPFKDPRLFDYRNYPAELYLPPGKSAANRNALAKWSAWVNAFGAREYGRPIFIASSADLAGSTNISGFAEPFGDFKGYGWYERVGNDEGALLPQEITEFTNSGMMAGIATVNLAADPEREFDGFWAASSTYGSFAYLLYGPMRLFSQLAQDCDLKVGKALWVAGHSGPETAEDSRTHFGIFAPGVTQLFPEGQIINLHPWEHNEVPVLLAAALATDVPIIALHLTRPPITIPDREKLGIPSHFEAARGAYIIRDYKPGRPCDGTFIVQGTSAVNGIVQLLPQLDESDLNIKIVCATSHELFARQPASYREQVIGPADRVNSTVICTQARITMRQWLFNKMAEEYAMTADWDNRWRTGGTVDEVIEEAHLSPKWLLEGIRRFVADKERRMAAIRQDVDAAC
ncbi:MAG: transketolase-like TK C-terminal-containing protein [Anaerolineae bacterium]